MIGQLLTGRYLILEKLGAGGFSETYLARDKYLPHHPLCVAKCLKLSATNPLPLSTAQRLFHTEAQVLGELGQHHAQIPTLLAYSPDQAVAYQIQEYIAGNSLGQRLQQGQRLTSDSAIALLLDVLPVLQFVHDHQIVHRDLKPSNLIYATESQRMVLIDFGAACRLTKTATGWQPEGEDANLAIGTPGYMPPEQQTGQLQFSSDLYALGVSMIFLLTGVHPRKLEHNPISGELDWHPHGERAIHPGLAQVLGGMVRQRARDRYQTVAEVLQAMTTFVSLPATPSPPQSTVVLPFPKPRLPRWSRWARRSLVVTSIVGSLLGGSYFYAQSVPAQAWMARLSGLPSQIARQAVVTLPMPAPVTQLQWVPGDRQLVTAHSDRGLRLWSLPDGKLLKTMWRHRTPVAVLAVSSDGNWLLSGDRDRTVHLWQLPTGQHVRQFEGASAPLTAVAFSPDGRTIASGSEDGTVRLWQRQTGIRQQTLARYGAAITALTFNPAANLLISANSQFELQVWNLQTRQLQRTFAGHTAPIRLLQMLEAETVVSVGDDRTLVWQLQREELMRTSPRQSRPVVAALVRDRQVITLDQQGTLQTWNPDTDQTAMSVFPQFQPLQAALSATGRYGVAWDRDRQFTLWQHSPPL